MNLKCVKYTITHNYYTVTYSAVIRYVRNASTDFLGHISEGEY